MNDDDGNSEALLAARYHLACPLCKKAKGQVLISERAVTTHVTTHLACKTCGDLGTIDWTWDWATPSGLSARDHGLAAAEIITVRLSDNPPNVVTQLAALARRSALESLDLGESEATARARIEELLREDPTQLAHAVAEMLGFESGDRIMVVGADGELRAAGA